MLIEELDLYSLLIPFFLFGLGVTILVIRLFHKIPNYFIWFSGSTFALVFTLVFLTVINTALLPSLIFIPIFFLLLACAMLSHAIALRLKIKSDWVIMLSIMCFTLIFYSYFALVDEKYTGRMITMTFGMIFILMHNAVDLYKANIKLKLDRWLRITITFLAVLAIIRSLYLFLIIGADNRLLSNILVTASTQLIILFTLTSIAILLYGATYQEILTKLNHERNTDPLTGLLNRRAIYEHVSRLKFDVPQQHAVILCDIDHFKKINDIYGHNVGDLALKHITDLLSNNVRHTDKVSRFGGEEFMIVLQNTPQDVAVCIAERLRQLVEQTTFCYQDLSLSVTLSFGVSTFYSYSNFDMTLQDTDILLYQAKKFGRNKVEWQIQN